MSKKISVGNPGRLVITARRAARENCDYGYVFDPHTGGIIYYSKDETIFDPGGSRITDDKYPVYTGQQYIGYVMEGKFISLDGVLQGYVDTEQERKIRKKREELRNLLCSRFS